MTYLVEHRIRRFVASQAFFAEMLMRLGKAFDFRKPSVERHGRMVGILRQVQIGGSPQLFLNY